MWFPVLCSESLLFIHSVMVGGCSVVSLSLRPCELWPPRLCCPRNSPCKNIGMGCHFLLQGIFPTQVSKPCLLHLLLWHADSLPLMPHGKPLFIPYKDIILNISFLVERGSKRQECLGFIRNHLALLLFGPAPMDLRIPYASCPRLPAKSRYFSVFSFKSRLHHWCEHSKAHP